MIRNLFLALSFSLTLVAALSPPAQAQPSDPAEQRALNDRFLTALAALDQGQAAAAIPVFRSILASYPGLVRVRLELGRAYYLNRQWREARREFERVLATDLPAPVRLNVLRFIRQIDARRGFDWDLDLAVTRLGNSQQFDSDEIELDFGPVTLPTRLVRSDTSAWGISYAASARLSTPLEALSSQRVLTNLVFAPFAYGDFAEPEELRDSTVGARLGLRFSAPRTTTQINLISDRRDLAQSRYETRTGLELQSEHRRGGGLSLFGSLYGAEVQNHQSDAADGDVSRLRFGLRQGLGSTASLGASLFGEWRNAEFKAQSYHRYGLSLFGDLQPGWGLEISASAYLAHRDFPDPNPLFTNNPDEREWGGTLRIEKQDLFLASRFTPYIQFDGRRVSSGVKAFSYTETSASIGVEKAF